MPNASWETKVLAKFLSRQDNEASVAEDDKAWAWIDDREICTGRSRGYKGSFDSKGLRDVLEQLVRCVLPFVTSNLIEGSALVIRPFEMSISV